MRARNIAVLTATVLLVGLALTASSAMAQTQASAPATDGVHIDGDYGPWLPPDISTHGHRIDQLLYILHGFMALLFVGWGIFFVYCLVKFRQRPGHTATHELLKAKPAKWVEGGVVVFEAILLLGFAVPIWAYVKNDLPPPDDANVERVRIVAEQFAWNFHYPGADGVFGRTSPDFVDTAINILGLDPADENGKDDIVSGEFHIPVDKVVVAHVTSKDVIHSFSVGVLRIKQDTIPGMRIPVWFTATKTGNYEVACAQLCGNNHYSMRAVMFVQTADAYAAWLAEKAKPPEEFDEDEFD